MKIFIVLLSYFFLQLSLSTFSYQALAKSRFFKSDYFSQSDQKEMLEAMKIGFEEFNSHRDKVFKLMIMNDDFKNEYQKITKQKYSKNDYSKLKMNQLPYYVLFDNKIFVFLKNGSIEKSMMITGVDMKKGKMYFSYMEPKSAQTSFLDYFIDKVYAFTNDDLENPEAKRIFKLIDRKKVPSMSEQEFGDYKKAVKGSYTNRGALSFKPIDVVKDTLRNPATLRAMYALKDAPKNFGRDFADLKDRVGLKRAIIYSPMEAAFSSIPKFFGGLGVATAAGLVGVAAMPFSFIRSAYGFVRGGRIKKKLTKQMNRCCNPKEPIHETFNRFLKTFNDGKAFTPDECAGFETKEVNEKLAQSEEICHAEVFKKAIPKKEKDPTSQTMRDFAHCEEKVLGRDVKDEKNIKYECKVKIKRFMKCMKKKITKDRGY